VLQAGEDAPSAAKTNATNAYASTTSMMRGMKTGKQVAKQRASGSSFLLSKKDT
jgi:hypothetical protein